MQSHSNRNSSSLRNNLHSVKKEASISEVGSEHAETWKEDLCSGTSTRRRRHQFLRLDQNMQKLGRRTYSLELAQRVAYMDASTVNVLVVIMFTS